MPPGLKEHFSPKNENPLLKLIWDLQCYLSLAEIFKKKYFYLCYFNPLKQFQLGNVG